MNLCIMKAWTNNNRKNNPLKKSVEVKGLVDRAMRETCRQPEKLRRGEKMSGKYLHGLIIDSDFVNVKDNIFSHSG